jgi:hypothetical protein
VSAVGEPDNEALQQTRSALTTTAAALAAERRCSADLLRPESPTDRLARSKIEGSAGTALLDGLETESSTAARRQPQRRVTLLVQTAGRRPQERLPGQRHFLPIDMGRPMPFAAHSVGAGTPTDLDGSPYGGRIGELG